MGAASAGRGEQIAGPAGAKNAGAKNTDTNRSTNGRNPLVLPNNRVVILGRRQGRPATP